MSASPSGLSNGQTPTPNGGPGGPPGFVRKAKPADPLRPRKKPVRRPNGPPKSTPGQSNGVPTKPTGQNTPNGFAPQPARGPVPRPGPSNGTLPPRNVGWSKPPGPGCQEYPLFTTKRALREGLRYHVARFSTAKPSIDPTNQDEFPRPVLLHRRDPRQPPPGKGLKEEDTPNDMPVDSKEREKLEALKAEKERQKAEDLKQIAPTGNNAAAVAQRKTTSFRNEKTTQVHHVDKTEEQKKASDLRYEEALPWHIEDADNKQTWVGNYEAALSNTNVMFVIEGSNFKMVPIEKWYKFTSKNQFKTYTIEEAEAQMSKKTKESRWVMKTNEEKKAAQEAQESRKITHGIYTVKSESATFKNSGKREVEDMDDLDFAADDLFQDDDEQATFEPENDEDTKDAKEKIKREQLGANIFGEADEAEVDKELEEEMREKERTKKEGKSTRKALKKRERNLIYQSDSDHPYSTASDDDTSDEEKQAEIDRKKDEEAKNKAKLESKTESKLPSGASSKGTNTPSGRPKHSDPLKKSKSLKRPSSPNLSESSGNESSRKKQKKKHGSSSVPTGTSTPVPGSRQISPAPISQPLPGQSPRKSSIVKLNVNPSRLSEINAALPNPSPTGVSMSDGEATGGEMSDGGRKKKIKLRIGGPSPTGSRAGSPTPGRADSVAAGASGSRAGSPQAQIPAAATENSVGTIQASEIRSALPKEGISIQDLLKLFNTRIGDGKEGKMEKREFIALVKDCAKYKPTGEKLLIAK